MGVWFGKEEAEIPVDNQEEVSSEKTGQHTSWSWKIWAEEREGGSPRVWVGVRGGDRGLIVWKEGGRDAQGWPSKEPASRSRRPGNRRWEGGAQRRRWCGAGGGEPALGELHPRDEERRGGLGTNPPTAFERSLRGQGRGEAPGAGGAGVRAAEAAGVSWG